MSAILPNSRLFTRISFTAGKKRENKNKKNKKQKQKQKQNKKKTTDKWEKIELLANEIEKCWVSLFGF